MENQLKDIAIYGAGGFGREVFAVIHQQNKKSKERNIIGFFDDGIEKGSMNEYGTILGGVEELNSYDTPLDVVVAIGTPNILREVVKGISNPNISFPNIIDESVYMSDSDSVKMGKGNIILGGCGFTINIRLGDFNILNGDVLFGHDVKVGDCNVFMSGTKICGGAKIGDCNLFGMNTIIIQQIEVGDDTNFGAGSVMMTKPKSGATYIGVPAKQFKF